MRKGKREKGKGKREKGKGKREKGKGKWETETQCRFIEHQNLEEMGDWKVEMGNDAHRTTNNAHRTSHIAQRTTNNKPHKEQTPKAKQQNLLITEILLIY